MMTRQARPSAKIMGFETHMILEAVPARHSEHHNGHQAINRTSRHYAGALLSILASLTSTNETAKTRTTAQFGRANRGSTLPGADNGEETNGNWLDSR